MTARQIAHNQPNGDGGAIEVDEAVEAVEEEVVDSWGSESVRCGKKAQ